MVRAWNRLTARMVKALDQPGAYADGGGLYLRVRTDGSKVWTFRYMRDGRAREMSLGPVRVVSLKDAREKAGKQRSLLVDGIDPIAARRADRGKRKQVPTFRQACVLYIGTHGQSWRNAKHRAQWESTLKIYTYSVIGDMPVSDVDTGAVMKVLEPIWHEKPETASRLRGRIERVLDWAAVRGDRWGDNPARWRGHLQALLPAKTKVRSVKHFRALPWQDMPAFMAALRERGGISPRALEYAILTAARSGEVRLATWDEIDLDARLWTIPAERMKARKEHRVPLCDRSVAILEGMKPYADGELIFPGQKRGRPMSDMSLAAVLKRMQIGATVHGFRSTFRDWAAETTNFPREVAEHALAHSLPDKVEAAYRRGDLFDKRRKMMDAWAAYCERKPARGDNVRPMQRA